ncbi:MAG: rhomboid family intramembrane serine protease [Gammaproteobacteria bacterium]
MGFCTGRYFISFSICLVCGCSAARWSRPGGRAGSYFITWCVLGAGLCQLIVASWAVQSGQLYPTLGASGGVYGLLLAFGMRYPNRIIMLLIPLIPMPAKYFVILFAAFELWSGITGTRRGRAFCPSRRNAGWFFIAGWLRAAPLTASRQYHYQLTSPTSWSGLVSFAGSACNCRVYP